MGESRNVFISGATGYLGLALIDRLLERGHQVNALARPGSESKLPAGCAIVSGNALDSDTFVRAIPPAGTFVHLVGVPHPAPWKGKQFRAIDLVAAGQSIAAAQAAEIAHFVYVSVAQPAPVMKSYIAVRRACEATLRQARVNTTILRPWYVLGPGHRWPAALLPLYGLMERIPAIRDTARRLGLVTLEQMTETLLWAVENPCTGFRVLGVPAIRDIGALACPVLWSTARGEPRDALPRWSIMDCNYFSAQNSIFPEPTAEPQAAGRWSEDTKTPSCG
jgi:uncharacterized protein YbjT (DUF2867 family)